MSILRTQKVLEKVENAIKDVRMHLALAKGNVDGLGTDSDFDEACATLSELSELLAETRKPTAAQVEMRKALDGVTRRAVVRTLGEYAHTWDRSTGWDGYDKAKDCKHTSDEDA